MGTNLGGVIHQIVPILACAALNNRVYISRSCHSTYVCMYDVHVNVQTVHVHVTYERHPNTHETLQP